MTGSITPTRFKVEIGGYPGPYCTVEWADDILIHTNREHHDDPEVTTEHRPRPASWLRFWALLNDLDAWDWASSYQSPEMILDGTSWSVHIEFEGRVVKSSGSNAYPGGGGPSGSRAWDRFCSGVEALVGRKPFR